jgi:Asp-tRNA(Asn)/Glu-tRNA(Gln) amidotransferase A subunit family amidase
VTNSPPPDAASASELVGRSAAEMIAALDAGRVSARALLAAHLTRVDLVDPWLHAVAARRDDAVLAAAEALDARRAAGQRPGPLAGMPVSIKDMYAMQGWTWACGLAERADIVADHDADLVARLRVAGAVPFVRTATAPATMLHETVGRLTGVTRNPWGQRAAIGGSSGGEAALVAAGASPWGIGSDMGGSVRLPAHATGIVGLRLTPGRVPMAGQWPDAPELAPLNAPGVFARNVDDAARLAEALSGAPFPRPDLSEIPLTSVLPRSRLPRWPVGPEVAAGLRRVVDLLGQRDDVRLREQTAPELLEGAFAIWQALATRGGMGWLKQGIGVPADIGSWALLRLRRQALRGAAPHSPELLLQLAGLPFVQPSPRALAGLPARIEVLRARWDSALAGGAGVVLMPVMPTAAPARGSWLRGLLTLQGRRVFSWLVAPNVLGLPAAAVPVGWTWAGLPYAIQVIGAAGSEGRVLAVARAIEQLAGFRPKAFTPPDQAA